MINIVIIPRLEIPGEGELFGCSMDTLASINATPKHRGLLFISDSMIGIETDVQAAVKSFETLGDPAFIGVFVDGGADLTEKVFQILEPHFRKRRGVHIKQDVLSGMIKVVVLNASSLIQGILTIEEVKRGETS